MIKEQEFWDWFKENEAKFYFLNQIDDEDEKERLLNYFLIHLHEYCDQLFFEVGGSPNDTQDLIITAEGDTSFFEKVEYLVKHAPVLEHWNIIAFKPAKEYGVITHYKNINLNPNTMYFIPLNSKNSEKLGLRIYTDNYVSNDKEDLLTAVYIALDNILGEKSNALDIGHVEIESLPPAAERDELIELKKLSRYIKWKKSKLNT